MTPRTFSLLVSLVGLFLARGLAAQSPEVWFSGTAYQVWNDVEVGDSPYGAIVADLNRDGILDLATATCLTDNVTVFLGTGDGSLTAFSFPSTGTCPRWIAARDLNNDGILDLATANVEDSAVSILLGNGDGTFRARTDFATGVWPHGIAVGDFNGDGLPDLVTANVGSDDVSLLLGQGGGLFSTRSDFPVADRPFQVVVGDFNADGEADVVTATQLSSVVSILLGRGDGTFGRLADVPTRRGLSSIAAGDFNGDGALDLVTANHIDGSASFLPGNGDGTFRPRIDLATATNPLQVAAADFDADGRLDFVTASERGGGCMGCGGPLTLYLGHGDGTFSDSFRVGGGAYPTGIATGDFNADGSIDLAVSDAPNDAVTIFLQSGRVTFDPGSLAFAVQEPGTTSSPKIATVRSTGSFGVNISQVALAGVDADQFSISADECSGASIPSGSSCAITVVFSPTRSGDKSASVVVHHDAPDSPDSLTLSGIGASTPSPEVSLSPNSVSFGDQAVDVTSDPRSVTLTNTGNADLTISAIELTNGPIFEETNNCSGLVASGASCTFSVTFTPLTTIDYTGSLTITDDAPGSPHSVTLSGSGITLNNPPSFTIAADPPTVLEDSGPQTVTNFVTDISAGAEDEAGQTVTFNITGNTNPALFSALLAVDAAGTLNYTPAADAFGTAAITLVAVDDGGTAGGGNDTSVPRTFTITLTGVNDAPSFVKGLDEAVSHPAGPQTVAGWATHITAGPSESGQIVTFLIANDNEELFSVQPTISPTGTLSYTPVPGQSGTATVTASLKDDGGTDDGGVDTSLPDTFIISVMDFTLAATCQGGNPPCDSDSTATITAGESVHFDIIGTPIPVAPYRHPVTMACMNLPAAASCTFTPSNSLDLSAGPQTVTLIVTTSAPSVQPRPAFGEGRGTPLYAFWLGLPPLAFVGLRWTRRGRKKDRSVGFLAPFAVGLLISLLLFACGDPSSPSPQPGTPPGTHTVSVIATAGTLEHALIITVLVQ